MSRSKATPTTSAAGRLRCAIYTRKSSDEGLEQSFNSLHAQRDACEAYVASQAGEGWTVLPTLYDDGGFSGGSMERPALKQLLADVEGGRIDIVVVYKVDRLTRSLADFAKIVERFDGQNVSFVSVTQAFNTTSSMGRLTLNVLLSFAQFEREVTGERIRDKIALSKARGMWMGGVPPLGYDAHDRTLVINPQEAEVVRFIYQRYLEIGSVHRLRQALESEGVRSKRHVTTSGKMLGGEPIGRGALFHILQNRLYLGEIVHKTLVHPGRHPALLDRNLFDKVQKSLATHRIERRTRPRHSVSPLLTGKLFDACGAAMSPTLSYGRSGKAYRYYVSTDLQKGVGSSTDGLIRRVNADRLEQALKSELERLTGRADFDLEAVTKRVELKSDETHIVIDPAEIDPLSPALVLARLPERLQSGEAAAPELGGGLRIVLRRRMQLRGGRVTLQGGKPPAQPRAARSSWSQALRTSHQELIALDASPLTPSTKFVRAQSPSTHYRRQLAKLAFLAPDIQCAIMEGRIPEHLELNQLLKSDLPIVWSEQRALFQLNVAA